MSLSRRELEELKPMIDKTVRKFIGFSEPTIVTVAVNCVDKGYDQRKTVDKLLSYLDEGQAKAFSQKLFDTYEEFKALGKHGRTRKRKDETRFDEDENTKRQKQIEGTPAPAVPVPVVPDPGNPSPGQLTADKIKEMMANAQKMISERKAQLGVPEVPVLPKPSPASDLVRRQQELQARIQSQMLITGVGGDSVAAAIAAAAQKQQQALAQQQSKPTPLILDEQGRTIDATTGETIQLQHHMPTLKANIRAKRREQFKAVQEKPPEEISESKFFDPRVAAKGAVRSRRGFRFHEKGKFESLAGKLRTKAQLEKLQNEIAQAAKKTGIASAAKLATIQPKKELREGEIPEVEWWDSVILLSDNYDSYYEKGANKFEGVTFLIEHPTQMRAPAEPTKAPHIPVMLTKKERKKLRRQSRQETQKELTEKIRLGLIPPPEPKVKMSNLMRVLGTEAVQDPTKVEQHVREQMVKRQKAHEEANAARKLTKEERRNKKIAKLQEDTSLGVKVSVYRVRELNNAAKKFKVETNAKQLYMTGFVVLQRDCNVVVVEGGPKQQKKFRRLMMHRIKWDEDKKKSSKKDEDEESDEEEVLGNSCVLVWEGEVKTRAFGEIKFKACPTESFAREQFKKCGVEHYWDLAYSGAVLETAGEEL